MAEILMINASPRAPKSNSKRYAQLFDQYCTLGTQYAALTRGNHREVCQQIEGVAHVLLVFPLYADAIPVTLLHFLKSWEENPPQNKPTVSVLINCGFLESRQNDVAVKMVRLFCRQNGYPFGSVLKIGSGEAILDSPFRPLVARKIKQLSRSIVHRRYQTFSVSMPLPRRLFVSASTSYWVNYGKRNGITKEQMETMQIEGE